MNLKERISQIVEIAYERLCGKITGKRIEVDNEASPQLQFASILKTLGELYEETSDQRFNIELEKNVALFGSAFPKSGTEKAKIDIWLSLDDAGSGERHRCAFELKYFKRDNHAEPNNRYGVFKDLHNLEHYGGVADTGFLLVVTDHLHYFCQPEYSDDTRDFDFRDGSKYQAGTKLVYRTQTFGSVAYPTQKRLQIYMAFSRVGPEFPFCSGSAVRLKPNGRLQPMTNQLRSLSVAVLGRWATIHTSQWEYKWKNCQFSITSKSTSLRGEMNQA